MKSIISGLLCVCFLGTALRLAAVPRVALMDFSTDDNSYRSTQAAADFTSLLQAQLAADTNVEWVEREQLDKARQEQELSTLEAIGGATAIRRGQWAGADWLITGQFSLDDRNQRTLFLEITDLLHADVLASQTIVLPGNGFQAIKLGHEQLETVTVALRQLEVEARTRESQSQNKIFVASLFFADVGRDIFSRKIDGLEHDFDETLERLAATNGRVQLIRFPRAYRSTGESEMTFDGLVKSRPAGWQSMADMYVWGICRLETSRTNLPPVSRLVLELHIWNEGSRAEVIRKIVPCTFSGDFRIDEMQAAINRLAGDVIARAQKPVNREDTGEIRRHIAVSLVDAYDQMTVSFHNRTELGLYNPLKFLQAVHILEMACFFDPDNADARLLYITCRWGWWMDFGRIKNEFWSKWRRSQAWGKYVERFGLKSTAETLPFPYDGKDGMAKAYESSLQELLEMFPRWPSETAMNEDEANRSRGAYSWLAEAERNGFPKEMPHELVWQWRQALERESWERLSRMAEFMAVTGGTKDKQPSFFLANLTRDIIKADQPAAARWNLFEVLWPQSVRLAQQFGRQWIINSNELISLAAAAGQTEKAQQMLAMLDSGSGVTNHVAKPVPQKTSVVTKPFSPPAQVSVPAWLQENRPGARPFGLSPPDILVNEVRPTVHVLQFPRQFQVETVDQLEFWQDRLLIHAVDERSAPSSDAHADVSADTRSKSGRLWILYRAADLPVLFQSELLKENINQFLLESNRLWVAGKITGVWDFVDEHFHRCAFEEGFILPEAKVIGVMDGNVFAGDGAFTVLQQDARSGQWRSLPKPKSYSYGSGSRYQIFGKTPWLSYSPSSGLFYNAETGSWTNLLHASFGCGVVDQSGIWAGGPAGLIYYDARRQALFNWKAPTVVDGLMVNIGFGTYNIFDGKMPAAQLERYHDQMTGALKKLMALRVGIHAQNQQSHTQADPFGLMNRIPSGITALANDGDFLWLGAGNCLVLLHKPSRSFVAYARLPESGSIASLAVSKTSVWVGTTDGDHQLFRLDKAAFLSMPATRWLPWAISTQDRADLIHHLSIRDQAMYAFYAGDDERVTQLLQNLPPEQASFEEMFLLAMSNDVLGVDQIERANFWYKQITNRYPASTPMGEVALAALEQNEQNHGDKMYRAELLARYDLNRDGTLDDQEKRLMEKDPAFQRQEKNWWQGRIGPQIKNVMVRFDQNGNGKLEGNELESFDSQVKLFSENSVSVLGHHTVVVVPFLVKNFPSVPELLKKYDTNHDGALTSDELKTLAADIQNRPDRIILPNAP